MSGEALDVGLRATAEYFQRVCCYCDLCVEEAVQQGKQAVEEYERGCQDPQDPNRK